MGSHSKKSEKQGDLLWTDWAFVFVLTAVAVAGSWAFVQYLFDRLW